MTIEKLKEKIEKNNLSPVQIYDLIIKTNDKEFMKKCIEKGEKLGLYSNIIYLLIREINEIDYTKQCLDNAKLLKLDTINIFQLIHSSNEPELLINTIINNNYNFEEWQINELIFNLETMGKKQELFKIIQNQIYEGKKINVKRKDIIRYH